MTLLHFRFIRSKRSHKKFVPNSEFQELEPVLCSLSFMTTLLFFMRMLKNIIVGRDETCELQDKKIAKEEESIAAED